MSRVPLILLLMAAAAYGQAPKTLGVCPFEDQTGTQSGEQVARFLPVMFLEKAPPGYRVILANPGPMPDPEDTNWLGEVGRCHKVTIGIYRDWKLRHPACGRPEYNLAGIGQVER